jgi:hypothetical protein
MVSPKKVWEEEWIATADGAVHMTGKDRYGSFHVRVPMFSPERARLAAMAGAMARLLLEMHKDGSHDGCHDAGAVEVLLKEAGVLP